MDSFGPAPILVLAHNDADGLASATILSKALRTATSNSPAIRIVGRGESPWSESMHAELAGAKLGGIIIADLGVRAALPRRDVPTLIIDHHVPQAEPENAALISGYGCDPVPTTSLLAYRAVRRLAANEDLLWLAALGIIGDMAEAYGFPEMAEARSRYGITALRKAAALINQGRRSGTGDAGAALALLNKASGPKDVLSGVHPETAELLAAAAEVKAETARARKVAPVVRGNVALILFSSGCQVHPLVAQTWTGRLRDQIVIAANTGFRPGWVHFAARSAMDIDLVAFLREHAPSGADENYGSGHRKATGGALRAQDWNEFIRGLGFDAAMEVQP